jgi:thymidylate kinase
MSTICLEGINGVGKTTQAALLGDRLQSEFPNRAVHRFVDPGVRKGHPAYEQVRWLARFADWSNEMTRMLLYMAARCELIQAMREVHCDDLVVLDRYVAGYYAYAAQAFRDELVAGPSGHMRSSYVGIDADTKVEAFGNITTLLHLCGVDAPDVTVIIFMEPELAQRRWKEVSGLKPDVYEKGGIERLVQLQDVYKDMLLRNNGKYPYAGKQLIGVSALEHTTPVDLHEEIWENVREHLEPVKSVVEHG